MYKRKSINKQNKRPSIKNLIIKGIDKLTGYHRKPDYYVHDYEKFKRVESGHYTISDQHTEISSSQYESQGGD